MNVPGDSTTWILRVPRMSSAVPAVMYSNDFSDRKMTVMV